MATVDLVVHAGQAEGRLERVVPWVSSFLVHAGVGLVGVFVLFVVVGRGVESAPWAAPVGDITDCDFPADRKAFDSERDSVVEDRRKAMQDYLKVQSGGNDPFGKVELSQMTRGGMSATDGIPAEYIGMGTGGTTGVGGSNLMGTPGKIAGYGDGLVSGGDGKILWKFHGKRIVYLLDHSGSMLDGFDFLRNEVIERTQHLNAGQQFSVIMFSEEVTVLGPERLQRATGEVKAEVAGKLRNVRAGGHNDGEFAVFKRGFERAFAMKPEVIIFLTDGNFDLRLVESVKGMNKEKVQVETVAFVSIDPEAEGALKAISRENGGTYKFVSSKDLGSK